MTATVADRVETALVTHVRPQLSSHAGSIRLVRVEDGVVHLEMLGSCSGCYFRRGCVAGVVRPGLADAVDADHRVLVDNARC